MIRQEILEFELVSYLFLGGAHSRYEQGVENNGDFERIRVRPIVGNLRFWFRALMGGLCPRSSVSRLENEIFGSALDDEGFGARFRLLLEESSQPALVTYEEMDRGFSYIVYGLQAQEDRKSGRRWSSRRAIRPQSQNREPFRFKLRVVGDDAVLPLLCATFWVAFTFGGLGARSRRGLGSIRSVHNVWEENESLTNTLEGIERGLERATAVYRTFYKEMTGKDPQAPDFGGEFPEPEFEIFHPDFCRIKLSKQAFSSVDQVLKAISNQLRISPTSAEPLYHLGKDGYGWRQRHASSDPWRPVSKTTPAGRTYSYFRGVDHDEVVKAFSGSSGKPIRMSTLPFGLPIPFKFGDRYVTVNWEDQGKAQRRPSPIRFTVIRDPSGKFRALCSLFISRFVPHRASLVVRSERSVQPKRTEFPGWTILHEFMDRIDGNVIRFKL